MIYRNVKKIKTDMETENNIKLMRFALESIDNFGNKFVHLSPGNVEKCKQIIFPDGFWVDDDKNVHTCAISPIYGYINQKNPTIVVEFPVWCEWRESNSRPKFGKLVY